jgi:hypothetical protein
VLLVPVLLSVDTLKPSGPVRLGFPLEFPMLKSPNVREAARAFGGLRIDTAPIINAATIEIAKIVPIVVWFIIIVV